jgi:hypothetical protein
MSFSECTHYSLLARLHLVEELPEGYDDKYVLYFLNNCWHVGIHYRDVLSQDDYDDYLNAGLGETHLLEHNLELLCKFRLPCPQVVANLL